MTTMQELHKKAGNPDLSHWKSIKLFSLIEASLLTVGLEPCEYNHFGAYEIKEKLLHEKPINWQYALMLTRSLVEAICTQELKSPLIKLVREDYNSSWSEIVEQAKISIDDISCIECHETKIHRDELLKWLKKNGYFESPQQNIIRIEQPQQSNIPIANNAILALPEPIYTTPPLKALQGVINEFWIDYDPEKNQPPPKQAVVMAWIEKNYPLITGNDLRLYIDKICRHPNAKGGGNKKTNQ